MNLFSGRGQIKILKYHQTRAPLPPPLPDSSPLLQTKKHPPYWVSPGRYSEFSANFASELEHKAGGGAGRDRRHTNLLLTANPPCEWDAQTETFTAQIYVAIENMENNINVLQAADISTEIISKLIIPVVASHCWWV